MAKSKANPVIQAETPVAPRPSVSGHRGESAEIVASAKQDQAKAESFAEELAAHVMDEVPEPEAKAETAKPEPKATKPQPAEEETEEVSAEFDPEAPILDDLGDEDGEAEDAVAGDEDDEPDAAKTVEALKKENFKQREKARELKQELEALKQERENLTKKLSELESQPAGLPDLGPFAELKTAEEIGKKEGELRDYVEWLDDLLDDGMESYTLPTADGGEREFTRADLRAQRKAKKAQMQLGEKAREALRVREESETVARKRYPWVFDGKKPLNAKVLDLVKETPALNALPNKALLLGRMVVGKLVESGEFMLVPRDKGTKAAAKPEKPQVERPSPATAAPPRRSAHAGAQEGVMERLNKGEPGALTDFAMSLLD